MVHRGVLLFGLAFVLPAVCFGHPNHWRMENEGFKTLYRGADKITVSVCVDSLQPSSAQVTVDGRSTGSGAGSISLRAGECATVHGQVVTLKSTFNKHKTVNAEGRYEIIR